MLVVAALIKLCMFYLRPVIGRFQLQYVMELNHPAIRQEVTHLLMESASVMCSK